MDARSKLKGRTPAPCCTVPGLPTSGQITLTLAPVILMKPLKDFGDEVPRSALVAI
jgi:hypothetical protein